jgi:hypothetical protein
MSDEWLDDHDAVPLIRNAHGVSEAVAVKLLVEACAESLVRAWQRGCWEPNGFGLSIPAFVWHGAHFADGVLHPAGTSPLNPYNEEGGYGHGVNGIIEFNADDLRIWLNTEHAASKERMRPQRKRAEEAIAALWPDDVPGSLPNKLIRGRVRDWLKLHDSPEPISDDTIDRAAHRKAPRALP